MRPRESQYPRGPANPAGHFLFVYNTGMKKLLKKIPSLLALLFWMGVIFYLSNQPGLSSHSPYDLYLRKAAHITEFFVLTLLAVVAARQNITTKKQKQLLTAAAIFAFLYAMSDEWHQSWVHDRHASPIDVSIDTIGIVLAYLGALYWWVWSSVSPRRGRK